MRWRDERRSDNVEDERSSVPTGLVVGGGAGTLVLLLIAVLLGADPRALLQQVQQANPPGAGGAGADAPKDPAQEELKDFVAVVLGETEDVWREQFQKMGKEYRDPKLRLFSGQVRSACGMANAAVGPFYCPGDEHVYLDLAFFQELKSRFKAPGEFAQAYVVAHEVGHHVQNLLGISEKVSGLRGRISQEEYNRLSVRLELQADFLAGVWANHVQNSRKILEAGDLEAALRAATAIGDDKLQREAQGYVVPDSFTHGTSAQRVRWFRRGFETGDISQGDTFKAREL